MATNRVMARSFWHFLAGLSGMSAIGLGVYGAHGFKPQNPHFKETWRIASNYHLIHTVALLGAPLVRNPNVFGGLVSAGILGFSGTCYTVAYMEDRKYGVLAPFGGFLLLGAWGSLLF